jgi:hypothetical protein
MMAAMRRHAKWGMPLMCAALMVMGATNDIGILPWVMVMLYGVSLLVGAFRSKEDL